MRKERKEKPQIGKRYYCRVIADGELTLMKVVAKNKVEARKILRSTYKLDKILEITDKKVSLYPKTAEYYHRKLGSSTYGNNELVY